MLVFSRPKVETLLNSFLWRIGTESSELADPLDILPENYDDSNYAQYDDYDPNDVPADQVFNHKII